jgi:hypothetical protein
MNPGEFKAVTANGTIIGFIYQRKDGCFEAVKGDGTQGRWMNIDVFDTKSDAKAYIKKP